jgi:radical SAM protein with 4Fe4S-binding SPASM domain
VLKFCPAENATLAVAADGWLYPCFMFNGDDRFKICRFMEDGKVLENRSKQVKEIMKKYDKSQSEDCCSCWANSLCSGCIGGDLIESGSLGQHCNCELMRAIAEAVLLELAAM